VTDAISVARGVSWRVLHTFFTNKAFLLPSVAFPLFFFTAFVGGLSRITQVPGFDFPAGYTARDFESGFMRRLMLAAPNRSGILLGYVFSALIRWATVAAVVTIVALLAQMKIGGNGVDLFGLYALALLLNLAGTLWATGVAMRLRTQQAAPVMQMPVFLLLFFAPVYVPLNLLQGWIHGVASVNPITALLEAGRGFISGSPELALAAFAIGVGLIVGFGAWAVRGLRRAEAAG